MRLRLMLRATAFVAFLAVPSRSPLLAQAPTDSARTTFIPEIVVTATKIPFAAVTTATTVLNGDALRRQGITSLADALRLVPGLAVVQTSSPGTRTSVYTRGGESGYTRVLIDGVPANEPGGDFDYATLTLDNVDRIEIVRGPSSVLYGTDAVSGVIQVFTREGHGGVRPRAEIRGGTFNTRAASGSVSGGTMRTGFTVGAARSTTDGIHAFNSGYDQTTLNGALRIERLSAGDLRATAYYADATVHVPTDGAGAVVDHNAFQGTERLALGLDAGKRFSSRVEARLILSHHRTVGGLIDRPDDAADTLGFYAQRSNDRVTRRSIDLRTNVQLTDAAMLTSGVLVEQQVQRGMLEVESEFGPFTSLTDVNRVTRAGYAQLLGAGGSLTWNVSGRVDASDVFGTFGTWRAGAAYDAGADTHLRAAVGRAFREPTFYQNFADGFVLGNPDLRPEKSIGWEVGIDQRLADGRVLLRGTWFAQQFTDLIEYSFAAEAGTPSYYNIAGARARGLEVEAVLQLTQSLSADANHTWLRTSVTDAGFDASPTGFFVEGVQLLRRPAQSGTARLSWHTDGHEVSVRATHRGARDDLDYAANARARLPASTTVDVAANAVIRAASAGTGGLAVTGRLSNAFGAEFESVLGFRAPGRALTIGIRLD